MVARLLDVGAAVVLLQLLLLPRPLRVHPVLVVPHVVLVAHAALVVLVVQSLLLEAGLARPRLVSLVARGAVGVAGAGAGLLVLVRLLVHRAAAVHAVVGLLRRLGRGPRDLQLPARVEDLRQESRESAAYLAQHMRGNINQISILLLIQSCDCSQHASAQQQRGGMQPAARTPGAGDWLGQQIVRYMIMSPRPQH